jgi:predicted O-methyltransferase YrrM
MIDPSQLITSDIVEETRAIYEKANQYNLTGINFIGDAVVIYGAAKILMPKIICEVGTASGLSSVLMLEGALKNGGRPTLYSYDMLNNLYYDHTRKVGFFLYEVAPHLERYFHLRTGTGSYATAFMDDCKNRINLAYIDANHCSPWAALDLLALLPAMENNAYLMFDATDIPVGCMQGPFYIYHHYCPVNNRTNSFGCKEVL